MAAGINMAFQAVTGHTPVPPGRYSKQLDTLGEQTTLCTGSGVIEAQPIIIGDAPDKTEILIPANPIFVS